MSRTLEFSVIDNGEENWPHFLVKIICSYIDPEILAQGF